MKAKPAFRYVYTPVGGAQKPQGTALTLERALRTAQTALENGWVSPQVPAVYIEEHTGPGTWEQVAQVSPAGTLYVDRWGERTKYAPRAPEVRGNARIVPHAKLPGVVTVVYRDGTPVASFADKDIGEAREFADLLGPLPHGMADWSKVARRWNFVD